MEYYAAMIMVGLLLHTMRWMNLTNIMLKEKKTDTMYNIMWNRLNQMILIQITKWLSVVLER